MLDLDFSGDFGLFGFSLGSPFSLLIQVLNLNELAENPKYKTNTLRVKHRKELLQLLAER